MIDEVHEFYVAQRNQLPEEVENFFALIGQNGGDVLIMTQWINRVHQAVRARIERKNVFQKLTAVGLKSRYRVTDSGRAAKAPSRRLPPSADRACLRSTAHCWMAGHRNGSRAGSPSHLRFGGTSSR